MVLTDFLRTSVWIELVEKPSLSNIMFQRHFQLYEGIDAKFVFKLVHPGQHPLIFHADSEHLANRYVYLLVTILRTSVLFMLVVMLYFAHMGLI
jgi:hypothetical protein